MTNEQALYSISCNPKARITIVPKKKTLKDIFAGYQREPEVQPVRQRSNAEILSNVMRDFGGDNNGK